MQDLGIISPSLEEFRERAVTHRVIPVCIKILADSLTPIGIYRSLVLHDGAARYIGKGKLRREPQQKATPLKLSIKPFVCFILNRFLAFHR